MRWSPFLGIPFVIALISFIFFKIFPFSSLLSNPPPLQQHRLFRVEELAIYNGSDPRLPIYLGILGSVFDVTKGKSHYGLGGGYNHFAGRDASRAFVSGNFTGDGLTDSLVGLSSSQVKSIVDWRDFYFRTYIMEKSTKKSGPGADKRFWSEEEDKKLIDALLELANTGKYCADNGFKPGHYTAVENKLSVSLPNSGLRAEPHIASRMKTLKKHFNIVHDMLCGLNTSGFGYDSEKKCVVAETEVWEEYLKSHKDAQKFKGKPFPYYQELCIVFGKDRATGKYAETPANVIEDLIMEERETQTKNSNDDFGSGLDAFMEFMHSGRVESTSTTDTNSKKKRKTTSETIEDTICDVIKDFAAMISSKMEASSERLSLAIEDANINDQKRMLKSELMKLQDLSKSDRHKATIPIGRDRDLT